MIRQALFLGAAIGLASQNAALAGTIVEDFTTDPTANGWIDASANNFEWHAGTGSILGGPGFSGSTQSHLEEAFYVDLGATLTEADNFSASWEATRRAAAGSFTNQESYIGFFNSGNWFLNGASETFNPVDVVAAGYWDAANPPHEHLNVWARGVTSSGTFRDGVMQDVGGVPASATGITYEYDLTYTAGAGANAAGQIVVDISLGGVLQWSQTSDLQVGDTFSVNSFGIFTGHTGFNDTPGWTAAWPLDNVVVNIPEPTSLVLLGLGALSMCSCGRKR